MNENAPGAPADGRADVPAFVRGTRAAALACLAAMVLLGLAWELWLAPTGQRTWAVKVLPLLIPLPGLLKYRMYSYRWVSLLVWLYFAEGVVRANGLERGWAPTLALVQVGLSLGLFVACTAHVRWRLRHAPPSAKASGRSH